MCFLAEERREIPAEVAATKVVMYVLYCDVWKCDLLNSHSSPQRPPWELQITKVLGYCTRSSAIAVIADRTVCNNMID